MLIVRQVFAAAAALSMAATAFAADPVKPEAHESPSATAQRDLVLASAEVKPSAQASGDSQAAAPVRHRTARVTTCRCGGDPQPQSDSADSE